jgi:hypothetical protein
MSLFKKANNRPTHLKAAFTGFAGSGKTHTAVNLAIGLIKHMKSKKFAGHNKPAFMFDTERGNLWISPLFDQAGIELQVAESRAYVDLKEAMNIAQEQASVFLIDSITHPWIEFTEAYQKAKNRRRGLEFQDWAYLKTEWRRNFTEPFLNSPLHIIMCGRAGHEYSHYTDEAGKKQIEKTGVKLKAEGELGFEPNLLVYMEREQDAAENKLYHIGHVYKDRRTDAKSLDGKSFRNPTYKTFLPHIEFLDLGGAVSEVDTARSSARDIPKDASSKDRYGLMRDVVVEEIKNLINKHHGGQSAKDKEAKLALVQEFFAPTWTEVEQLMSLDDLRNGFDRLHRKLEVVPSRYAVEEFDDELPAEGGAPAGLSILSSSYAEAKTTDELNATRDQQIEFIKALSEGDAQKEAEAYGAAVKRILKAAGMVNGAAVQQVAAEASA